VAGGEELNHPVRFASTPPLRGIVHCEPQVRIDFDLYVKKRKINSPGAEGCHGVTGWLIYLDCRATSQ